MTRVEPVIDRPAAVADLDSERVLLVADVHVGIEAGLRYERGVELADRADERRERLLGLIDDTDPDRLVVLGDLAHRIGTPAGDERAELDALVAAVTDRIPMTLVEGNHDSGVTDAVGAAVDVIGKSGGPLGDAADPQVAVCHGHAWPDPSLWEADVVCMGHEHPRVRLEDAVGGSRTARAWLRGSLSVAAFEDAPAPSPAPSPPATAADPPTLVVFPAFNERSGGTCVNVDGDAFLAPFLPAGLDAGEVYLLDGTRLGDVQRV